MPKIITIPEKFLQADDRPFRQAKRGPDGEAVLRRDDKGAVMRNDQGEALVETEDSTFLDMLKGFLNTVFALVRNKKLVAEAKAAERKVSEPVVEMTIEDSSLAYDIFRAIRVVKDGKLELEKAPYERLLEWVNKYGVDIFSVNAAVFREPLITATDGETTRGERRRQEKS